MPNLIAPYRTNETVYGRDEQTMVMFDLYNNPIDVKKTEESARYANGWGAAKVTCAVTGTAIAGGVTEAQIATGGETLIFTLTNGTWAASAPFNALRQAFLDLLRAAESEAAGWNVQVVAGLVVTNVVRTSATVATITTPVSASYSVSADENVTLRIPAGMVLSNAGGTAIPLLTTVTPAPATFVITAS